MGQCSLWESKAPSPKTRDKKERCSILTPVIGHNQSDPFCFLLVYRENAYLSSECIPIIRMHTYHQNAYPSNVESYGYVTFHY